MFSSMLVALKPKGNQEYVLDHALTISDLLDAQLSALAVIDVDQFAPPEVVPIGGGVYKQGWDAVLIADARKLAEQMAEMCKLAAENTERTCPMEIVDGPAAPTIARHVQEHDLLILGHASADPTGDEALLRDILKQSPRPAMVVPKHDLSGASVLVAYDGSVQSARTLASFAYSGLGVGLPIHVLACHADRAEALALCAAARRFLRRHDLPSEPHTADGSPGDAILSVANRLSVGLLVMGAYSRTSVAEFFFGSTTRQVLRELPAPVFLDH